MSLVNAEDSESPLFRMADESYIKRKIELEEESGNNQENQRSLASMFHKLMQENYLDDIFEIMNAVLSFLLAFTFAIESYYQTASNKVNDIHITPQWIELFDLILIIWFMFDFLLFFFIHTESRILYLFSFDSFITYITIIPTAMLRMGVIIDPILIEKYYLTFYRVLRLFSVLRLSNWFTKKNFPLARV